jgi:hypothetical protein
MHAAETHLSRRSNWLRAAVLGANDGIVSTASLVLGVAASGATAAAIMTAGIAGLVVFGMQGRGSQHVPKLTDQMSRVARHLNGEGQPPRSLTHSR